MQGLLASYGCSYVKQAVAVSTLQPPSFQATFKTCSRARHGTIEMESLTHATVAGRRAPPLELLANLKLLTAASRSSEFSACMQHVLAHVHAQHTAAHVVHACSMQCTRALPPRPRRGTCALRSFTLLSIPGYHGTFKSTRVP